MKQKRTPSKIPLVLLHLVLSHLLLKPEEVAYFKIFYSAVPRNIRSCEILNFSTSNHTYSEKQSECGSRNNTYCWYGRDSTKLKSTTRKPKSIHLVKMRHRRCRYRPHHDQYRRHHHTIQYSMLTWIKLV